MIKLLKSGNWALEGVHVVEVVEGEVKSFGSVENCKLVDAGWAEWAKVEEPKTTVAEKLRSNQRPK